MTVYLEFAVTSPLVFVSLQILDVRDVMVVVSRWYGGILLGPDRFKHINNCARNILMDEGYVASAVRHWRGIFVSIFIANFVGFNLTTTTVMNMQESS